MSNPPHISFKSAFLYWLKLGFISFGGPAGQISMMHAELVEKRRWISEKRYLHALNYTMVLPGPEAQQLATYIGWLMHGVWGGIVAGGLFILPSFFILSSLTWVYLSFGSVPALMGVLYGIKPAVTAIVVFAAYRIGSRALKNNILRAIALAAFVGIFLIGLPFPLIVLGAGFLGLLGAKFLPTYFQADGHAKSTQANSYPAIIDDQTPIPKHATFSWKKLLLALSVGLGVWAATLSVLVFQFGLEGTFSQMGWFFTKAALLTFGGAYAVLPYVYQGGVEHYFWLSGTQMIDGLALGETTPGPLIMVVTFVGFVGGWTQQVFGSQSLALAGLVGASVATLFTFIPSFLFILMGGPLVEATRHNLKFTAPLTAITAAVVGVIVNLAVFFAYHVLWPTGFNGQFEWVSLVLGLLAFVALFRFKLSIPLVILFSGALGFVCYFLFNA